MRGGGEPFFLGGNFLAAGFLSQTTELLEAATATLAPRTQPPLLLITLELEAAVFLVELILEENWDLTVEKECPGDFLGVL